MLTREPRIFETYFSVTSITSPDLQLLEDTSYHPVGQTHVQSSTLSDISPCFYMELFIYGRKDGTYVPELRASIQFISKGKVFTLCSSFFLRKPGVTSLHCSQNNFATQG